MGFVHRAPMALVQETLACPAPAASTVCRVGATAAQRAWSVKWAASAPSLAPQSATPVALAFLAGLQGAAAPACAARACPGGTGGNWGPALAPPALAAQQTPQVGPPPPCSARSVLRGTILGMPVLPVHSAPPGPLRGRRGPPPALCALQTPSAAALARAPFPPARPAPTAQQVRRAAPLQCFASCLRRLLPLLRTSGETTASKCVSLGVRPPPRSRA